jgi:hypothetical protein
VPYAILSLMPPLFAWMFMQWGMLSWERPFTAACLSGTFAAAVLLSSESK